MIQTRGEFWVAGGGSQIEEQVNIGRGFGLRDSYRRGEGLGGEGDDCVRFDACESYFEGIRMC